jgi:hypothetical protein
LTFKDIKRKISLYQQEAYQQNYKLFERLEDKPIWIWNSRSHRQEDAKTNGDCCFNHIIGLPKKENKENPFYDYEKMIFDISRSQAYLEKEGNRVRCHRTHVTLYGLALSQRQ